MLRDVPQERDSLSDRPAPESETNRAKLKGEQAPGRASGRAPGSSYWLITKNENGRIEVLTTNLAEGEQALPVFGHEEEAKMFLSLGGAGDGWRVRKSTAGELVSVLHGPCARVRCVALDPVPVMLEEKTVGLVSLSRERFVDLVLSRMRPLAQ
jgi:hypothetical protein